MDFIPKIQADDARRQIRLRRDLLTCVIGVTLIVYVLIATDTFSNSPIHTFSFDSLATAFLKGHAYVDEVPSQALQEAQNPWDKSNTELWHWDYLYFEGRYYLYW